MPATSKKQFRFMQALAHGAFKAPGLSPAKAKEYVSGQSYKALPESAPVEVYPKIKKMFKY